MADEDARTTLDVPQVSVSNNEAPSTQQSQGHGTPQRDVVMADLSMDQAVSPAHILLSHEINNFFFFFSLLFKSPVDRLTVSSSHQHPQLLHQALLLVAREHQRTAPERPQRIQTLVSRCLQRRVYMVTRHADT